jgi:asparagine synthase (glutamine-hydrolysing)
MSGIYAIFQPASGAVNDHDILAMHQVFATWYNDDRGSWCERDIGLGHTMCWNTAESKLERLPFIDGHVGRRLGITADVRLDNRAELFEQLDITAPLETVADSRLLLAAYKKWGENLPVHLLGDFAFVIWDEARKQVFCARDHLGIKSLYYCSDGGRWVFANHVHALVAVEGVSKAVSKEAVCKYLKDGELYSRTRTFYKSVHKLPPATSMVVCDTACRTRQYWRVDDCPQIRLDSPAAYVERLRGLLEDAVACRVRSDYPIASHLSGGLDSSSIAVIAARQLARVGRVLNTYNWCPNPAGAHDEAAQEWGRGSELVQSEGIQHHFIDMMPERYASLLMEHDLTVNDTAHIWYDFEVRRAVSSAGQRTILSGWGGDQGVSNNGSRALADLFWHGSPLTALRLIHDTAVRSARPWLRFLGLVGNRIIRPTVPDSMRRILAAGEFEHTDFAGCATPDIQRFVKASSPAWAWRNKISVREEQLQQFHCGHLQNRLESWAASAHHDGIEYRYPLLDKRVVEFALGIPPECYWQLGYGRYLFRKANDHCLPESICWASAKHEPERVKRLQALGRQALSLLLARGYFSRPRSENWGRFVLPSSIRAALDSYLTHDKDPLDPALIDLGETVVKSTLLLRL